MLFLRFVVDAQLPDEFMYTAWLVSPDRLPVPLLPILVSVDRYRKILNDQYCGDASLIFEPHYVALAAMHVASAVLTCDISRWLQELQNVDMKIVH